jgi:Kef-type K+ transport system membrane component KefB/Trk K+ transport system NAD-binding subunit
MASLILILGLMIIGAAGAALLARWLQQPLILGYVLAGLLLGPATTGLISDPEPIALLSELGLIFLMFVIGLELDLTKLRDVGSVSVFLGFLQVAITATVSAVAAMVFGFTFVQGLYLGLLISFSSTLVVVKVLVDRHELSSLHGELTLGILVVQDILAVIGLSLLGALKASEPIAAGLPTFQGLLAAFGLGFPATGLGVLANLLVSGLLFAAIAFLFFRLIVPRASQGITSSSEIFFVSVLAAVFLVALFAGFFQFSFAVGAFVAGIALSSSLHTHDIIGRVKPLRDFFLILFFVSLGLQVLFQNFVSQFWLIIFILVGSLAVKPVITFLLLKLFRYSDRTSFMVAAHLAQVGEFGLVLVSAGVIAGNLPQSVLTGTVLTTIFTMTLTAYTMKYDESLYRWLKPYLEPFTQLFGTRDAEHHTAPHKYQPEAVIFGVNTMTAGVVEQFLLRKRKLLLVDANPNRLAPYRERSIPVVCSDATNEDLFTRMDFSKAAVVISTLHNRTETLAGPDTNTYLIKKVREASKDAVIIVTAETEEWGRRLYTAGATLVLVPSVMGRKVLSHLLSGEHFDDAITLGKEYDHELRKPFVYLRKA